VLPPWRDIDDADALADYMEDHPEVATLLEDTPGEASPDEASSDEASSDAESSDGGA